MGGARTRIPTRDCAALLLPPRLRTCLPTISNGPFSVVLANCPGATYEEFSLEGYGPGGVVVLLDINTWTIAIAQ